MLNLEFQIFIIDKMVAEKNVFRRVASLRETIIQLSNLASVIRFSQTGNLTVLIEGKSNYNCASPNWI